MQWQRDLVALISTADSNRPDANHRKAASNPCTSPHVYNLPVSLSASQALFAM